MITRISKALSRTRDRLEQNEKGFTLIELLVVVIIIGVLAAIAIPIYLNVQDTAKDSSVKSSVTEAKTAYVAYVTNGGTDGVAITGISGYASPTEISVSFKGTPSISSFCIQGYYGNSTSSHPYHITQNTAVATGLCP